jgi:hypothetical protein
MSGSIGDNVFRASGVIAAAAAGGLSWQDIETGATMTAEAGNGYWIDTTSNTCTITLPSSADNGDEIMFADYARTWGTYGIIIDSNGLNYQGDDDTFDVEYGTDGQALHIVYSGATNGWIPTLDKTVEDVPSKGNANGILGYGNTGSITAITNKVSSVGVVASDTAGVGTGRSYMAGCEYGTDTAIFAYGGAAPGDVSMSNLVSNSGVVSADVSGVGIVRSNHAACGYGGDKGIFGYGGSSGYISITNLVSNAGVIAADVAGVGTPRTQLGATQYGFDKGIFGYGVGPVSVTNLVSTIGVVSADVTGVGTARTYITACSYGGDKGIFAFGAWPVMSLTNLVSNAGVVAADVAGVGTARSAPAGCEYN